jgi:hypothetical protein
MKSYKEYEAELGPAPVVPEKKYKYFGYKEGIPREFSTMDEARTYSKINEMVVVNKEERTEAMANLSVWAKKVETEWKDDLWKEFTKECWKLSDGVNSVNRIRIFETIFAKAWDNRHSEGYDAVVDEFDELVDFAKDIIKLTMDPKV